MGWGTVRGSVNLALVEGPAGTFTLTVTDLFDGNVKVAEGWDGMLHVILMENAKFDGNIESKSATADIHVHLNDGSMLDGNITVSGGDLTVHGTGMVTGNIKHEAVGSSCDVELSEGNHTGNEEGLCDDS